MAQKFKYLLTRFARNIVKRRFEFFLFFVEVQHYAKEDINGRRTTLLEKRSTLQDKSSKRKVKLQDSYLYQQFDRDVNETKGWINEKLKVANDENYLDPTNLSGKLQKHQNFEVNNFFVKFFFVTFFFFL